MRRFAIILMIAALPAEVFATTPTDKSMLISGNTTFALDLYQREAARQTGNVFFSPYSISTAMAMVDAGARGTTATEIEKAMRFPFTGERLATAWTAVLNDVNKHAEGYELVTANALWGARGTEFRSAFLTTASRKFGARIETLNFASAASRKRINAWVSATTKEKIRELIGPGMLNADTLLVLTNAIYMKAKWATPFPPGATDAKGRFHAPSGDVTAPMMHLTGTFPFYRGEGVRVLELPYIRDELSMIIVLPDANNGLGAVEKQLTPGKLAQWYAKLAGNRVAVTFPKFTTEMSLDLGEALRAMGVRLAFDPRRADFSGMSTKEKLGISRVIHKARVDVSEEGTEAAAATAVIGVRSTAIHEAPPEPFVADHPFLFVIRRNGSNNTLFIGRLTKP